MIKLTPGRTLATLAVLAASTTLAACGGSDPSKTTTTRTTAAGQGGSTTASRTAFQTCLRQHGITIPTGTAGAGSGNGGFRGGTPPGGGNGGFQGGTPPGGSNGGFRGGPPTGGRFPGGGANSSKFRTAFKACGAKLPNGGRFPNGGRRPQFSHQRIQSYVTCVRKHGYNLPNPNFSGNGSVFPANFQSNKKFQTAGRACQSLLTPSGGTSTTSSN